MGTGANGLSKQMGSEVIGDLGQMDVLGKGYPKCPKGVHQVPGAHFPKVSANGHLEKLTCGGKGYPKCPVHISPKFLQMYTWGNGHLGEKITASAIKEYSKCPKKCVN